jgi:thiamine-phosphate pyrophosphorylase
VGNKRFQVAGLIVNSANAPTGRCLRVGVYAITPEHTQHNSQIFDQVRSALECNISALQYRSKDLVYSDRLVAAQRMRKLCREMETPFIVNDDVDLALAVDADGIHLGKNDRDYRTLTSLRSRKLIVGISCYNSFELAQAGAAAGVDYVAFGSFFPSRTKPEAVIADTALLERATRELDVPIVAIGGITPQNGAVLLRAGADLLAVISGIFEQSDVKSATNEFNQLFHKKYSSDV